MGFSIKKWKTIYFSKNGFSILIWFPLYGFSIIIWLHYMVSQSKNGSHSVVLNHFMVLISWFSIIIWFHYMGFSIKKWFPFRGSQSFYGTHLVVLNQNMVSQNIFFNFMVKRITLSNLCTFYLLFLCPF